jgi:hypothetical protein
MSLKKSLKVFLKSKPKRGVSEELIRIFDKIIADLNVQKLVYFEFIIQFHF